MRVSPVASVGSSVEALSAPGLQATTIGFLGGVGVVPTSAVFGSEGGSGGGGNPAFPVRQQATRRIAAGIDVVSTRAPGPFLSGGLMAAVDSSKYLLENGVRLSNGTLLPDPMTVNFASRSVEVSLGAGYRTRLRRFDLEASVARGLAAGNIETHLSSALVNRVQTTSARSNFSEVSAAFSIPLQSTEADVGLGVTLRRYDGAEALGAVHVEWGF